MIIFWDSVLSFVVIMGWVVLYGLIAGLCVGVTLVIIDVISNRKTDRIKNNVLALRRLRNRK